MPTSALFCCRKESKSANSIGAVLIASEATIAGGRGGADDADMAALAAVEAIGRTLLSSM